jgi:hypothetical protein
MLLAQGDRGEVLPLGLGAQAKPKGTIGWQTLGVRVGHDADFPIPTQQREFFNCAGSVRPGRDSLFYVVNFNQTDASSTVFA